MYEKQSFKYAAAISWNRLSEHIRSTTDLSQFSYYMPVWDGKKWHCTGIACSLQNSTFIIRVTTTVYDRVIALQYRRDSSLRAAESSRNTLERLGDALATGLCHDG